MRSSWLPACNGRSQPERPTAVKVVSAPPGSQGASRWRTSTSTTPEGSNANRSPAYNTTPFQKREGSRRSVFASEERPLLGTLPAAPFEISQWVYGRKVGRNGHVVWSKNYYSVPFAHIGAKVDLRITQSMIEIYRGDERLASHLLLPSNTSNKYRTNDADLPEGRGWQPWDRTRIDAWAARVGPATKTVTDRVFESVQVDEQAHDPALAILRLTRRFSPALMALGESPQGRSSNFPTLGGCHCSGRRVPVAA